MLRNTKLLLLALQLHGLQPLRVLLRAYVLLPDPSSSRAPRTFDESGIYVQRDSR